MEILLGIGFIVIMIIAIRLFGAWMLRIDEIIRNQKQLINSIERLNDNLGNFIEHNQEDNKIKNEI